MLLCLVTSHKSFLAALQLRLKVCEKINEINDPTSTTHESPTLKPQTAASRMHSKSPSKSSKSGVRTRVAWRLTYRRFFSPIWVISPFGEFSSRISEKEVPPAAAPHGSRDLGISASARLCRGTNNPRWGGTWSGARGGGWSAGRCGRGWDHFWWWFRVTER